MEDWGRLFAFICLFGVTLKQFRNLSEINSGGGGVGEIWGGTSIFKTLKME